MTRLVFETATLQDAIKKAERVAPVKGSAFDKSAGIVIEIDLSPMLDPSIAVRATNTDVFFTEWVDCVEATGSSTIWRLPSKLLAGLITSLPIGSGRQVVMEEKQEEMGRIVHLSSGKTRVKLYLMDTEYYPTWLPFDGSKLSTIVDFGGKLSLVEWAASDSDEKINGVYLDGDWAIATDRYRLVKVPLPFGISQPVTIPGTLLAPLLKQTGDIKAGTDGNLFLIEPNDHIQIQTIISGHEYPNVLRLMLEEYEEFATVKKEELLEIMRRSLTFTGADRFPVMRLFLGKEEINIFMEDTERGLLGDAIELPGQMLHDRCEINFTPRNIMEALEKAPNSEVKIGYNSSDPNKKPMFIDGGSGYKVWVMPRRGLGGEQQG